MKQNMMKKLSVSLVALSIAMSSYAQQENATQDSLTAAQDSIFRSVMLHEVKVAAPAKTRMKGDAMVTRIVGTVMANAGTAVDALSKVPGMMTRNGALEVIGKGTPTFYINGRKVQDFAELQRLSSHDIKNVEVITTPGARYDAQTSAVVIIQTLRKRDEGWGFSWENRDDKALSRSNNQLNSMLNVSYHHQTLDLFGGVNYGNNHLGKYDTHVTQQTFGKHKNFLQDGSTNLKQQYDQLNLHIGADWNMAEKHSIGMKLEHNNNLKGTSDFLMTNDISTLDRSKTSGQNIAKDHYQLIDRLVSNSHTNTDCSYSWLANAYYIGKLRQWNIDWNIDYYYAKERSACTTDEVSQIENRNVVSENDTRNKLIATKLIFSRPLWQGQLSMGTELAFVNRTSNYNINTTGISNSDNEVKENTYAAFAEYGKGLSWLGQLKLGMRYEHVDFSYDDALNASTHISRHQDDFYPYISLGTKVGQVQGALSYAVKTRRPNYRTLRSNTEYNNRFTLSTGNPTLKNEIRHEVGANARWQFLTFSLNYAYIKNGIYDWTYPYDDDGTVLVSWVNFDKPIHQLSAFINVSPTVGIWQPNYTVGIQKQWLSFCLDDPRTSSGKRNVSYNKPMLLFNLNNAFKLPTRNDDGKGAWLFEVNSELMSDCHYGNAKITNWSWNLTCAIQKSFLPNDALTIRLAMSDIFHKAYNNVVVDLGNNILTQSHILGIDRGLYDLQRITLTARYTFNVNKNRYKGNGASQNFIDRM